MIWRIINAVARFIIELFALPPIPPQVPQLCRMFGFLEQLGLVALEARYLLRDQCELVSRVMCRLPQTPWFMGAICATT